VAAIVLGAVGLSLRWVFLVPIYQSPDEPQHLDYALCLLEHGGLYQARDLSAVERDPALVNPYGVPYLCYFLHSHTRYLADRSEHFAICQNHVVKVPPQYGTRGFFANLDRDAPVPVIEPDLPPSLAFGYPFGYYALLAAWIGLLRHCTTSLSAIFFGARTLSVLLLAISLLVIYDTLRALRCPRLFRLVLTACIGFFPMTSFVSSYVQPDNLSLALVSLSSWLALRVRDDPDSPWLTWLGLALGGLLVTKQHYFACAMLPILTMLAVRLGCRRVPARVWLTAFTRLLLPSLVLGSVHLWSVWGLQYHPLRPTAAATDPALFLRALRKALEDFYTGTTHLSFWGIFGWMDTTLVIVGPRTTAVVRFLLRVVSVAFVALTLTRLAQVASRLLALWRRGRRARAAQIAVSNPVVNGYFLFTAVMVALHVATNNFFGAQGRNWLPYMLPIFWSAVVDAPRALARRPAWLVFAGGCSGLVLYTAVGACFALKTLDDRYYAHALAEPMQALAVITPSVDTGQSRGAEESEPTTARAAASRTLLRPELAYCARLRYRLRVPPSQTVWLNARWLPASGVRPPTAERYRLRGALEERSLTIWINDVIHEFRIDAAVDPDRFEVIDLTLLGRP
jgi:hypothetical protein